VSRAIAVPGPFFLLIFLATVFAATVLDTSAYYRYTWNNPDDTSCNTCHGEFRTTPYISLKDGISWGASLHDVHGLDMLNGDCDVCHFGGVANPVFLGKSDGGTGMEPLSCSGCHGRRHDGWDHGTMGYSFGLRMMHWIADIDVNGVSTRDCRRCHPDADPNLATASEWSMPPYYEQPGLAHPAMPTSPCNSPPGHDENFAGSLLGLDNDGDGLFDMADPDCAPGPPTPGEASGPALSPLLVTAYDSLTGNISISYGTSCGATSHNIYYGPLADVSVHGWSWQECDIGDSGSHTFNPGTGSWFIVVVASDGTTDGSYGRGMRPDRAHYQRPPFVGSPCGTEQSLVRRCD
jgi:hypothetical protein